MKKIALIFIFLFAIILRISFPENFSVGFDQIQILESASKIKQGDFTLIGPRTGPADMFTGPLIYYVTAVFLFIFDKYQVIYLVPLFFSVITGIFIFWLVKTYIGEKEALITTLIWACSPFLVSLDRVFWNPNLILLSSVLLVLPLFSKKTDLRSLIFLFLGSFLSYQAHFSGLVLLFLTGLSVLFIFKKSKFWLNLLVIIGGLLLSLLPTILFDLRNNFFNFKGLISLISSKSEFSLIFLLKDIFKNFYIIFETLGKLFFFGNNSILIISTGLILSIIWFISQQDKMKKNLIGLWLVFIPVLFSFYKGEKPEYYFLFVAPILFLIVIDLIKMIPINYQKLLALWFITNSLFINFGMFNQAYVSSIKQIKQLKDYLSTQQVKSLVYDLPYGSDYGLKYFLNELNLDQKGLVFHITEQTVKFSGANKVGSFYVWRDYRNGNNNYVLTNNYYLSTNLEYFLFENKYVKENNTNLVSYKIFDNKNLIAELYLADENKDRDLAWVKTCFDEIKLKTSDWVQISEDEFIKPFYDYCLMVKFNNKSSLDNLKKIGINLF